VYAVGHPALAPADYIPAAVLAGGPGAVASHETAAALWRMLADAGTLHVTTRSHRRGTACVTFHRTSLLAPADIRTQSGVPLTSPLRTLLDLAATNHPGFELALNEAQALRLVTRSELDALAASGRPGGAALRRLLDDRPGFTRGNAERHLRRLILKAQLPTPPVQRPRPRARGRRAMARAAAHPRGRRLGRPTATAPPSSATGGATRS